MLILKFNFVEIKVQNSSAVHDKENHGQWGVGSAISDVLIGICLKAARNMSYVVNIPGGLRCGASFTAYRIQQILVCWPHNIM